MGNRKKVFFFCFSKTELPSPYLAAMFEQDTLWRVSELTGRRVKFLHGDVKGPEGDEDKVNMNWTRGRRKGQKARKNYK